MFPRSISTCLHPRSPFHFPSPHNKRSSPLPTGPQPLLADVPVIHNKHSERRYHHSNRCPGRANLLGESECIPQSDTDGRWPVSKTPIVFLDFSLTNCNPDTDMLNLLNKLKKRGNGTIVEFSTLPFYHEQALNGTSMSFFDMISIIPAYQCSAVLFIGIQCLTTMPPRLVKSNG
ncbi:hypothetical protein EDC04DRAFT_1050902 [Pisolithus marmoratus]|nr:hypothetical protein EDC04DRAFT_1050902 [Pisolithus marmoratus]